MNRNKVLYLLLLVAMVYLPSCKKEDSMGIVPTAFYPSETDTTASFVACKLGGKIFLSYDTAFQHTNNAKITYEKNPEGPDSALFIYGIHNTDELQEDVEIRLSGAIDTGKYRLGAPNENFSNLMSYSLDVIGQTYSFDYMTSNKHQGEIHIKKWDKKKKWIAGTFYASLRFGNIGDSSIKVTEGLFNIHYD